MLELSLLNIFQQKSNENNFNSHNGDDFSKWLLGVDKSKFSEVTDFNVAEGSKIIESNRFNMNESSKVIDNNKAIPIDKNIVDELKYSYAKLKYEDNVTNTDKNDFVSTNTGKNDFVSTNTGKNDFVSTNTGKNDFVSTNTGKNDFVSTNTGKNDFVSTNTITPEITPFLNLEMDNVLTEITNFKAINKKVEILVDWSWIASGYLSQKLDESNPKLLITPIYNYQIEGIKHSVVATYSEQFNYIKKLNEIKSENLKHSVFSHNTPNSKFEVAKTPDIYSVSKRVIQLHDYTAYSINLFFSGSGELKLSLRDFFNKDQSSEQLKTWINQIKQFSQNKNITSFSFNGMTIWQKEQ